MLGLVGCFLLAMFWATWAHVLIDFGRELYVPWQLLEGRRLYVDLAYFNGPFSPYVNALWFRLFGVSLATLIAANAALLVMMLWLLYRVLVDLSGRLAALVASIAFLVLFALGNPGGENYNFLCPYSHEMTHGLFLSLAALTSLAAYQRAPRVWRIAVSGVATGLAFLTKPELFAALAVALLASLGLALSGPPSPRSRRGEMIAVFGCCLLAPIMLAGLLLSTQMPPAIAWRGVLGAWPHLFNAAVWQLPLYRQGFGTTDLMGSVRQLAASLQWYAFYVFSLAGIALLVARRPRLVPSVWTLTPLLLVGFLTREHAKQLLVYPFHALPIVLLLAIGVAVRRRHRSRDQRARHGLAAAIVALVFAEALLGKMLLNARIFDYGFALAMPATLLLVAALVEWLPRALERQGGHGGVFRAGMLTIITIIIMQALVLRIERTSPQVWVGRWPDCLRVPAEYGGSVNQALAEITRRLAPEETLAVLPGGVMLNYLARRRNPTPYFVTLPTELALFGEERVLAALRASPPDYIMLASQNTNERDAPFFGRRYAQDLYEWVQAAYQPVAGFGERLEELFEDAGRPGLILMQHKHATAAVTMAE